MWQTKMGWDDLLPDPLATSFWSLLLDVEKLWDFSVSRPYASIQNVTSRILIGFLDASEAAFGAVIYIQTECLSGASAIQLVCSKTRILPAKPISIHHL